MQFFSPKIQYKIAIIKATGSYVPPHAVKNAQLTQFPAANIALIAEKIGIQTRHYASEKQCTSDLAIEAAQACLIRADIAATDIDAIILATSSPDRLQPATATTVQRELGAVNAFAFDINSVCSGALYGLYLGNSLIRSGSCNRVLVIAAEAYSKFLNPEDFSTFPYFGDGAGAVLLEGADTSSGCSGIIYGSLHSDGHGSEVIQIPAGGSKQPGWKVQNKEDFFFRMQGKKVYDFAVQRASESIHECLTHTGHAIEEIRCVVAHQANVNILKEIASRTEIPYDKFFVNLSKYGNTAAASILIGLDEAIRSEVVNKNDLVVLTAFGGGLSWGTMLIRL